MFVEPHLRDGLDDAISGLAVWPSQLDLLVGSSRPKSAEAAHKCYIEHDYIYTPPHFTRGKLAQYLQEIKYKRYVVMFSPDVLFLPNLEFLLFLCYFRM